MGLQQRKQNRREAGDEASDSPILLQVAAEGREPCAMTPRAEHWQQRALGHDIRLGSPRTTAACLVCELRGLSAPGSQRQRGSRAWPPSSARPPPRRLRCRARRRRSHRHRGSYREGWVNSRSVS